MNCVIKAKNRDAYFVGWAQRAVPVFSADAFRAKVYDDLNAAELLSEKMGEFVDAEVIAVEQKDFA